MRAMKEPLDSKLHEIGVSIELLASDIADLDSEFPNRPRQPVSGVEYLDSLFSFMRSGDSSAADELANLYVEIHKVHLYWREAMGAIRSIADEGTKIRAFIAITHLYTTASLGLSKMPPISPNARRHAHRDHTKPAHAQRRKSGDQVQAIIEKHARALWEKKPIYRGNKEGTAKEIRKAVLVDITKAFDALEKLDKKRPKGWAPADENNKKAIHSEITKIATRVDRISATNE
jgi:hypothetical protein